MVDTVLCNRTYEGDVTFQGSVVTLDGPDLFVDGSNIDVEGGGDITLTDGNFSITNGNILISPGNTIDGVDVGSPANSITIVSNSYQLVNDEFSPGNNEFYGTNGAGLKGWYPIAPRDSYTFAAARNASISTNQDLRRQNGVFTNNCPYIVPYDSTIYAATAENNPSNTAATWGLRIFSNGVNILDLSVPNTDHKVINAGLSIDVNAGDEIRFRFRNASGAIPNPGGAIFARRR